METLLDVQNLGISFGGLRAVNNFSINIGKMNSFTDLSDLTVQEKQLYSTS